jgi:GNAT superfamily N-acetyltransferase
MERKALADGTYVTLRVVRPSDAALLVDGFERLSPESRYRRFLAPKNVLSPAEVSYFSNCDGINHFAIGAVVVRPDGSEEGAGVARFVRVPRNPLAAEAAVTVVDALQNNGLGYLLARRLVSAAAERGVCELQFHVLNTNRPMLCLVRKLGRVAERRVDSEFGGGVLNLAVQVRGMARGTASGTANW